MSDLAEYSGLLAEIKTRIQTAQTRAVLAVNAELIRLYWQIGQLLDARQQSKGWGAGVIPKLAQDLRNELPELKGFSERNMGLMLAFARAYPEPSEISQQPVAKIAATAKVQQPVAKSPEDASLLWQLPWGHYALLIAKVKSMDARIWYMHQTLAQGWSRNTLALQIDSQAHARQGAAISNFATRLPAPQSDLAQ